MSFDFNYGSFLDEEEEIMEPLQEKKIEISGGLVRCRVCNDPAIYVYPIDDLELLKWCGRPEGRPSGGWNCVFSFNRPEIYDVKVEAESCTVEGCLELLKRIGRESRFIAFSVDIAGLFFAELSEEDADKLQGLGGNHYVVRYLERLYHC